MTTDVLIQSAHSDDPCVVGHHQFSLTQLLQGLTTFGRPRYLNGYLGRDPHSALRRDNAAVWQTRFNAAWRLDQQADEADGSYKEPNCRTRHIGTFLHGHILASWAQGVRRIVPFSSYRSTAPHAI
ncbi:hypothetical protein EMIT0P228_90121 [Pseudomonas brassicacearum]